MTSEFEEVVKYLLETFSSTIFAGIIGSDGLPVAVATKEEIDKSKESAEITSIFNNASRVAKTLNMGNLVDIFFTTNKLDVLISSINESYFTIMVMKKPANIGRARLEIKHVISKLRAITA